MFCVLGFRLEAFQNNCCRGFGLSRIIGAMLLSFSHVILIGLVSFYWVILVYLLDADVSVHADEGGEAQAPAADGVGAVSVDDSGVDPLQGVISIWCLLCGVLPGTSCIS